VTDAGRCVHLAETSVVHTDAVTSTSVPDRGSLTGWVVGVTADRRHEEQIELLRRRGARVVHAPTLRTRPLGPDEELGAAIDAVIAQRPEVIVLSTGIGVRGWLEAAEALGRAEELREVVHGAELVARGPKAAGAAASEGWQLDWQAPSATANEVVDHLRAAGVGGRRVAALLDGRSAPVLAEQLRALGAEVVAVPVYRWELPEDVQPVLRLIDLIVEGSVDAVTFTSSPSIWNLVRLAAEAGRQQQLTAALSGPARAVCVGPVCAATARDSGFDRVIEPARARLGAMVHTLAAEASHRAPVTVGPTQLWLDGADAVLDGRVVALGARERAVLDHLARRPGAVVAKSVLRDEIWGAETGLHTVEVTVARLRERLAGQLGVIAVPRRGYRLVSQGIEDERTRTRRSG
jgi:uroporphyrinogen-III synthase